MDAVLHATAVYFGLMLLFRLTGERTLSRLTSFDFVLLMLVGRATTGVLLGNDYSGMNAVLVICTLALIHMAMGWVKRRSRRASRLLDGVPTLLVVDGSPIPEALHCQRVAEDDIMRAARDKQGLARMDQIGYAVLETSGDITIVPRDKA